MAPSSYDVVNRSIEFSNPSRLPIKLEYPIKTAKFGMIESDVHTVNWNFIGTGDHSQFQTYDEWHCLWVRSEQNNMGQIKGHPIDDWSKLSTYHWPDPHDPSFYDGMEKRFEGGEGKYIISVIFMLLFERLQALRGFENALLDLVLEREKVEQLADRILEFNLEVAKNIARRFPGQIHGIWFTEDWGTQEALMISPKMWRNFFKPRYEMIFRELHDLGFHIWLHSDGRINAIIEDLIELGVDVLNLQQPLTNGIEEVGEQFAGRICFETACDIQKTLPSNSRSAIEQEAKRLLERWSTREGGFILSVDENESVLAFPPGNVEAMLEAFLEEQTK